MIEVLVPTGKVKWFDVEKGFGFLSRDDGGDVFVHTSALPQGVEALKPGARVEFGVVEGKRGEQALSVRILEPRPSVAEAVKIASRKDPEEMAVIVEDLITLLERVRDGLNRGRYPEKKSAAKVSGVLRAVADQIEA